MANSNENLTIDIEEQKKYLKQIMTFSNPTDNDRRIGQDIPDLIEYDLVDESRINGHLRKRFVRLYKGYFVDMLKELSKGGSAYYTYLDDVEMQRGGKVPENLSVLIKEMGHEYSITAEVEHQKMFAEALGSRVLNFFGCKTAYNKVLNANGTLFVLSVDFLKPYQHFYVAEDICERNDILVSATFPENFASIDMDVDILKKRIELEFGKTGVKADKEQIKREYVKSYLVRVMLLGDTDFNKRNYGLVYDIKQNEITSAPNFDFELMFGIGARHFNGFDEKFKFVADKYPDIMEEFLADVKKLTKKGVGGRSKFDKMFFAETDGNSNVLYFPKLVGDNATYLLKYNDLQQELASVNGSK